MIALGYCGDDCNFCLRFVGTIRNNENELEKAAEIWFKLGWSDTILPAHEMRCLGCASTKGCFYGVKECCEERKINNCGCCPEYICEKLEDVFKRTRQYEEKSKLIFKNDVHEVLKKAFYRKKEYLDNIKQKNKIVKK